MKETTKRFIAGVSAAALFVSAVGSDVFTNWFTVFADSSTGKNGRSTGFSNLEQDTEKVDGIYVYNTGYGLHTNKTATALDDGRTFDVNLESWYVGENPVDVATILDASGSMAWTVNTLEPLKVSLADDILSDLKKKYLAKGEDTDLSKYSEYASETSKVLAAIQDENDGYLPQEVVDKILDNTKTDNTKLGYDKYMYYVYEARSSVSEFVPLGYWDGGIDPKNDPSLIGYYPFSGTLENKAPNAEEGAAGKLINHPTGGEAYDTEKSARQEPEAAFSTETYVKKKGEDPVTEEKGLDIMKTAPIGGVLLDSPTTDKFTIKMNFSIGHLVDSSNQGQYGDTTFLYITDGENSYKFYRRKEGSKNRMGIRDSKTNSQFINANNVFNDSDDHEWTFEFDFSTNTLKLTTGDEDVVWDTSNTKGKTYSISLPTKLNTSNLKVILGYTDKPEEIEKFSDVYVKSVKISDDKDSVAEYEFSTTTKSLQNSVNNKNATFVQQGDHTKKIEAVYLDPVIIDNKYLDVKATSQLGAVSLDAVPALNEDGFTISMKLQRTGTLAERQQNIFYLGNKNKSAYYQFFRSMNAGGYLGLSNSKQEDLDKPPKGTDKVYYQGGMAKNDIWYTNTLVFETDPEDDSKYIVTPYINGKAEYQSGSEKNFKINKISVDKDSLVFLLGALESNGSDSDQYLDDLYVFNDALDAKTVELYFSDEAVSCDVDGATHAQSFVKDADGNIVKNEDGSPKVIEIAQISNGNNRLGQNTNIDQRRGWYYVNSASAWADITGCLASGKQYIGIFTDDGLSGDFEDMAKDTATVPSGFAESTDEKQQNIAKEITNSNTNEEKYTAPDKERSIRFYVDKQNHLRCFVWSGATTKNKGDERTFCSVVYEKKDNQKTKYEELNSALNTFYKNLADYSDLSNTSVVRFSTNNAVDKDEEANTNTNLQKLIMRDWTNWSDYYQEDKKEHSSDDSYTPNTENYLQDLLDSGDKKSTDITESKNETEQYPYVMTGGTYTWTGLKAFYDNMITNTDNQTVKNVANDARDKYLIIFTDGRDNTQDYNVSDVVSTANNTNLAGSPDYDTGSTFRGTNYVNIYNPYKDDPDHLVGFSIVNYDDYKGEINDSFYSEYQVQEFKTGVHKIEHDGDLAQAWADKLKEEGYTIYCVMLATGSISPTANADEYNKAKNFLKSLSGGKDADEEIAEMQADMDSWSLGTKPDEYANVQRKIEELKDNYVIIVDPTTTTGTSSLESAFAQILEDIQQPREDYTVQDYIDPRFDLIGGNSYYFNGNSKSDKVIYHLGAGGKIMFTDENNNPLTDIALTYKGEAFTSGTKVGNIIDDEKAIGIPYVPQESCNINGTGYIYYDDEKDMYYLRWEEQEIPMANESFDTQSDNKYLDAWSATIRLKAKDDFIGGNNILTNGNEAGENLVYSDATIENMDKNPELYFADYKAGDTITYRQKLEALSGTNRKINAVDADGVSQAVYGDGIDIPSSGFPRVTVNVRLKPLDAKNLNDVIYMGEVVSPTMMLADLENDYMTGSYYLEYLERYAYRLYGKDTDKTPLLDLLNEWLKINNKEETAKTFTIPYMYLPDPIYENDKLKIDEYTKRVIVSNSTGASWKEDGDTDFTDLNLRDVTGFITYTWKRNDGGEKQQENKEGKPDITKEYIVKNTNQIKYNLQLKFTPLHEGELKGFDLDDEKFITSVTGTEDIFFEVDADNEFAESTDKKWEFTKRSDYLQAMVKEEKTYTPHVEYNESTKKWQLSTETTEKTNEDTYDWDTSYKPVVGNAQIEGDKLDEYYTDTLNNVGFTDKDGNTITDKTGVFITGKSDTDVCSLVANTTYIKDVVNGALALELVVDGKYLKKGSQINPTGETKTFTFEATRYYDDPIDPLPYGDKTSINADTVLGGKKYQLTFKVDSKTLPDDPNENQLYPVWATLTKVEVESATGDYETITTADGYTVENALPIGTYVISVNNSEMEGPTSQYYIGKNDSGADVNFIYLKTDNAPASYSYDKFPDSVYKVSETATTSTGDGEYLIKNGENDNSPKNIADSNRTKTTEKQTLTFYFGTVDSKEINGETLQNTKGYSRFDEEDKDYAKDRLGIILLSVDPNSLANSKVVTNTDKTEDFGHLWEFTVTFAPNADEENLKEFTDKNETGFALTWYALDEDGSWNLDTIGSHEKTTKFGGPDSDGKYTATIQLKHGEKVIISGLQEGKWQVTETDERETIFYSAHNNMDKFDDYVFSNKTNEDIVLNPASHVDFVNEFPYELPSTGSIGINRYIFFGTMFAIASTLFVAMLWYDRRKRRTTNEQP